MKHNDIQVLLVSDMPLSYQERKEWVMWLLVIMQPVVDAQDNNTEKITMHFMKDLPPIYLS